MASLLHRAAIQIQVQVHKIMPNLIHLKLHRRSATLGVIGHALIIYCYGHMAAILHINV